MSVLGYVLVAGALLYVVPVVAVLALVHCAPVGESEQSRLDEFDEHTRQALNLVEDFRHQYPTRPIDLVDEERRLAERIRFEQMLHPSSGNGLCDLDRERS